LFVVTLPGSILLDSGWPWSDFIRFKHPLIQSVLYVGVILLNAAVLYVVGWGAARLLQRWLAARA
jgi:apolipoprotein N-acyltransferase